MSSRSLAALTRLLDQAGDPDDVLRATVAALTTEPEIVWAGIAFLDEGELVLGPAAGEPDEARRTSVPILFQDSRVGELRVDGAVEPAFLERVAALLAVHVLIGWDTHGEAWEP